MSEHIFMKGNYYKFGFNFNNRNGKPNEVIVARPTIIDKKKGEIIFDFIWGHNHLSEKVAMNEIIAVVDSSASVQFEEWTQKYTILNQELYEEYLRKGILNLRERE